MSKKSKPKTPNKAKKPEPPILDLKARPSTPVPEAASADQTSGPKSEVVPHSTTAALALPKLDPKLPIPPTLETKMVAAIEACSTIEEVLQIGSWAAGLQKAYSRYKNIQNGAEKLAVLDVRAEIRLGQFLLENPVAKGGGAFQSRNKTTKEDREKTLKELNISKTLSARAKLFATTAENTPAKLDDLLDLQKVAELRNLNLPEAPKQFSKAWVERQIKPKGQKKKKRAEPGVDLLAFQDIFGLGNRVNLKASVERVVLNIEKQPQSTLEVCEDGLLFAVKVARSLGLINEPIAPPQPKPNLEGDGDDVEAGEQPEGEPRGEAELMGAE